MPTPTDGNRRARVAVRLPSAGIEMQVMVAHLKEAHAVGMKYSNLFRGGAHHDFGVSGLTLVNRAGATATRAAPQPAKFFRWLYHRDRSAQPFLAKCPTLSAAAFGACRPSARIGLDVHGLRVRLAIHGEAHTILSRLQAHAYRVLHGRRHVLHVRHARRLPQRLGPGLERPRGCMRPGAGAAAPPRPNPPPPPPPRPAGGPRE